VIVTVAVPVLDGGATFAALLDSVHDQAFDGDVELLVADSGSRDGSADVAAQRGAALLQVPKASFSHGATRNLLASRARGDVVVYLTQDAVPASRTWLTELVRGLESAPDVALSFGPYVPRPDAPLHVRRELLAWFASFSTDGSVRVDRLGAGERAVDARDLLGPRAFFTDANGCVRRSAWQRVPFRAVPYAEDHQLALDMLRAGYAKAYVPSAQVIHSHTYSVTEQLRRAFDEWRALREVYGYLEPLSVDRLRAAVIGETRADVRELRAANLGTAARARAAAAAGAYHAARYAGGVLGTRADRLSPVQRRRLSLERRSTFVPASSVALRP
jgi:rhamnosyltransferase